MYDRTVLADRIAVTLAAATILAAAAIIPAPGPAHAGGMTCRKVVAKEASGEGRNALEASRAKCGNNEFLTGGICYPEVRPEPDGSCQTSAMGIIQTLADYPGSTTGAFFTCLQTGGTDCAVEERTRAMAICCRYTEDADSDSE